MSALLSHSYTLPETVSCAPLCRAGGSRLVTQPRAEPSLDGRQIHLLAQVVVRNLVAADPADGEILCFRVRRLGISTLSPHPGLIRRERLDQKEEPLPLIRPQ